MPNEPVLKEKNVHLMYPTDIKKKTEGQKGEDFPKEYDFYTETEEEDKKLISVYIKKSVCRTQEETVETGSVEPQDEIDIVLLTDKIKSHPCHIDEYIISKFKNKNKKKINEVISRFVGEGRVKEVSNGLAYYEHNQHDIFLVIDFHNNIIKDIVDYKEKKSVEDNTILIKKDKMRLTSVKEETHIRKDVLLCQLDLLASDIVDAGEAKQDIQNHFCSAEMDEEEENLIIETKNCKYVLHQYNIVDVIPQGDFSLSPAPPLKFDDFSALVVGEQNAEYMTKVKIQDFYEGKAHKYLYKFGLSIKVITKFNTEGNNINDLYDFLMEDIMRFGYVLYDNYMENCMIIKTRRFYYLVKNSVIINIKDSRQNAIEECSIPFKKVYVKEQSEKTQILDLDIGDRIRDYITYDTIHRLKMKHHAIERYKERISRKKDPSFIEMAVKQDIYKHGTIYMGTYFKDTKLVKGLKNVYIIDNNYIISVWRINPVIEKIGERYQNLIEEITLTEMDESEILSE